MTKVLLVEPEKPLMRVMEWVLVEAGFEVIGLKDARTAEEQLPEIQPDVTVLNGEYADAERAAWLDRLRARWPEARVIDVHRMQVWGSSNEHADASLVKPFHADTLVDAINDFARQQWTRRMARRIARRPLGTPTSRAFGQTQSPAPWRSRPAPTPGRISSALQAGPD